VHTIKHRWQNGTVLKGNGKLLLALN